MDIHEVIKDRLEVVHRFYKGKTVYMRFIADDTSTDYGGKSKDVTVIETKGIINHPANPKNWGNTAIMGAGNLELIVWEDALKPFLTNQFFIADNYDNIQVLINEEYYRIIEIQSPESWGNEIPYWNCLLTKLEHSPHPECQLFLSLAPARQNLAGIGKFPPWNDVYCQGQTITLNEEETICLVELYIGDKFGTVPDIICRIYETDGGGTPIGAPIAESIAYAHGDITADAYNIFEFTSNPVLPAGQYLFAFELTTEAANGEFYYVFVPDNGAFPYAGGTWWFIEDLWPVTVADYQQSELRNLRMKIWTIQI